MRRPSAADHNVAVLANERGAHIRGQKLTGVRIDDWDEKGAFEGRLVRQLKGTPGDSEVAAVDVAHAIAAGLNSNPRSFDRAVLRAFGQDTDIGSVALRRAYRHIYAQTKTFADGLRRSSTRVRLPPGVLAGPFNRLARETIAEVMLGEEPLSYGVDEMIRVVGLPGDLRTFPPDEEASDYPDFVQVLQCLTLSRLPGVARAAIRNRSELEWATDGLKVLLGLAISVASCVDLTRSPLPVIQDPDPIGASSGEDVIRILVTGGRLIGRLLDVGNGSLEYLSAFMAPVLLAMLEVLPTRARGDVDSWFARAKDELPRMLAVVSLIEATPTELRHLLGVSGLDEMARAPLAEREAVRAAALAWSRANPFEAALLGA